MMQRSRNAALRSFPFAADKFENIHQVAGIQTALIDHPNPGGRPGAGGRIALVNTGAGLRFTVALDRGGDIVDAFHNQHSLAFLTANGYKPPSHAYHTGLDWLFGWPGGLVTTCGPQYVGGPRQEDGSHTSLHGHYSNTPAAVEMLLNPDPRRGRTEMLLSLIVRDSRMFGPLVEVRRQIQCHAGQNQINIYDQVTNLGSQPVAHNWLYHVNLGYPLLDRGSRLIYQGQLDTPWGFSEKITRGLTSAAIDKLKNIPDPLSQHAGAGEQGLLIAPEADNDGLCHVGLINRKLGLGVELVYPQKDLPRLANWQHFGPRGSYVCGIEPFSGSLMGKAKDQHPQAGQTLAPGQTHRYQLTLNVLVDKAALAGLAKHDGKVRIG